MGKCQVIKCKCGARFAACREPECYTDKEWQRDLRKYVKGGYGVELLDSKEFSMEMCKCKKEEPAPPPPTLFDALKTSPTPNSTQNPTQ